MILGLKGLINLFDFFLVAFLNCFFPHDIKNMYDVRDWRKVWREGSGTGPSGNRFIKRRPSGKGMISVRSGKMITRREICLKDGECFWYNKFVPLICAAGCWHLAPGLIDFKILITVKTKFSNLSASPKFLPVILNVNESCSVRRNHDWSLVTTYYFG